MRVIPAGLSGAVIIEPRVFGDARGFFFESWSQARYEAAGLPATFVQDNVSRSSRGVLRGLHFQNPRAQGKLVTVLDGEVFDVAVDLRIGSPTYARAVGVVLSGDNKRQLYVPPGFAHGFCVTSELALFSYKCTELYSAEFEHGIAWDDPDLAIAWPIASPTLSEKDARYGRLRDLDPAILFKYPGDEPAA